MPCRRSSQKQRGHSRKSSSFDRESLVAMQGSITHPGLPSNQFFELLNHRNLFRLHAVKLRRVIGDPIGENQRVEDLMEFGLAFQQDNFNLKTPLMEQALKNAQALRDAPVVSAVFQEYELEIAGKRRGPCLHIETGHLIMIHLGNRIIERRDFAGFIELDFPVM